MNDIFFDYGLFENTCFSLEKQINRKTDLYTTGFFSVVNNSKQEFMTSSSSTSSHESSASYCFLCHKQAPVAGHYPICESCLRKSEESYDPEIPDYNATVQNFKKLVPSKSIEQMSMAISRSSSDLNLFENPRKSKNRQVNNYYHSVNEWISVMDELNQPPDYDEEIDDRNEVNYCVRCATYCSFGINFMLLMGKALAMSTSSSYTIMSSLADSCLDIIAGIIISCTAANAKITDEDKLKYPVGKSRISTVGILVFSVLMSCCAIFIMMQCLHSLLAHENAPPTTNTAVFIMLMTIFVKFCMWILYNWIGHPITMTLAEDHRNDVFTNSFGLFMYYGGDHFAWWMDSAGGLMISLFVLHSWSKNAMENAKMLIGEMAPPDIIRNVTYVAAHHHPLIQSVSKVVAYQIGPDYFTEVHVVLQNNVISEAAFWVADSLTKRLERIEGIEHAYVHLETINHDPKLIEKLEEFHSQQTNLQYNINSSKLRDL